ncbi:MAG: hypothetical protein ACYCS7_15005 [Acidimicrobiales bacterium]
MAIFYHLERRGESLRPGQVMNLFPLPFDGKTPEETAELQRWFPDGVSLFGLGVLDRPPADWTERSLQREVELERIRRADYAHLASRLVSIFACSDLDAIDAVRGQFFLPNDPGPRGRIWKIDGESAFWGDMDVFREYCNDPIGAAHAYWSQERTSSPIIEFLLIPPVTVMGLVAEPERPL